MITDVENKEQIFTTLRLLVTAARQCVELHDQEYPRGGWERRNYLRGLKQSKSSIQNLLSIGVEVASVLPSYWFGKKPFPKHGNVSDYVEWVGFSRFAPLIDASWNKGDGDWNTFNRVLKG